MKSIQFQIRRARASDVRALSAVINGAYRGDSGRLGWTTEADFLDGQRIDEQMLKENIERVPGAVMVAESEAGEILGCVGVHVESSGDVFFGMLTVRVDLQRRGLGDALMKAGEDFARDELGVETIKMHVIWIREELIAWYEKRGFLRTGSFAPFPYGESRFGIPKRSDLRFEVLKKDLG